MWLDLSDLIYTTESESRNLDLLSKRAYSVLMSDNEPWLCKFAEKLYEKYKRLKVTLDDISGHVKSGFFLACKAFNMVGKFFDYAVFYILQYVFCQVYDESYSLYLIESDRQLVNELYNHVVTNLDTCSGANYYSAIVNAADELDIPLTKAIKLFSSCISLSINRSQDLEAELNLEVDRMNEWSRGYTTKENVSVLDAPLPFILALLDAQSRKVERVPEAGAFVNIHNKFWQLAEA